MSNQGSSRTLMAHLGMDAMGLIIQKNLFGGQYVRFSAFLTACLWLYQKGAILGRARRDRLEILAAMLSAPGYEVSTAKFLQDSASNRLALYGHNPSSFFDFFMATEYQKAGITWPPSDPASWKLAVRMVNGKLPLAKAEPIAKMRVLEGIGLGASSPDLVESMWRNTYEDNPDPEEWAQARRAGLDLPEQFAPIPLEEMEQQVLLEVASYANEYFPDLVEPLGLHLT